MIAQTNQTTTWSGQLVTSGSTTVPYRWPQEFHPLPMTPTFPGPVLQSYPDLGQIKIEAKPDETFLGVLELVAGVGKDWVRMRRLEEVIIEMLLIELEPGEEVPLNWFIS